MAERLTGAEAGSVPAGVPEGRCGFTLDKDNNGEVCCWRKVWEQVDTDRCIWHADVKYKPSTELPSTRDDPPERLDGAVLNSIQAEESSKLSGTYLIRANLSNAYLRNADLSNTVLFHADLTNAQCWDANFNEAKFDLANLSNGFFRSADFTGAGLWRANLTNAFLRGANLSDSYFGEANLTDCTLWSSNLADAEFSEANLSGADLHGAKLNKALFWKANLTDADISRSTAISSDFRRADLSRTDFFDTDLSNSDLYGAIFADTKINRRTVFGNHRANEFGEGNAENSQEGPSPWDKAAWTYRQLHQLALDNALPNQAREYHVTRKDIRRAEHREKGGFAGWYCWLKATISWVIWEYGESPRRLIASSLAVIGMFGFIFPYFGGMEHTTSGQTESFAFEPILTGAVDLPHWITVLSANLYFSGVTFTTLGYGDIQPATPAVEMLATLESFIGALLMALLVFVLGRRSTW